MRRMYSEQELTKIIKEVVGVYIDEGAFDESIADYVDAYLVEHPVDITALEGQDVELKSLVATDSIVGKTLKQTSFSYEKDFNLASVSNLTIENIYNRFAEINNVLHCIVNIKITNNTESSIIIGDGYGFVANASINSINSDIASKILDIDGYSVAQAHTNGTLIASEPCQIMKAGILDVGTTFINARLSLVNRNSVNTLGVQVALNGGTSNRLTLGAGETIYVTSRIALTLL